MLFTPLLPGGVISTDTGTLRRQVKVKRRTQPQISVAIAPQFCKGLVFAYNGATNTLAKEGLCTAFTKTGTTAQSVDRTGKAVALNVSGSGYLTVTNSTAALPNGMTYVFLAKYRNAAANGTIASIMAKNVAATGFDIELNNGGGDKILADYNPGGGQGYGSFNTSGFVNGVPDSLYGTYTTTPNTWYSVAGTFAGVADSTNPITIGRINTGFTQTPVDIAMIAVWNRILTKAELQSISVNPWKIFQPTQILAMVATRGIVSRPNSDITASGWSYNSNTSFYDAIDEPSYNDTDAIISPSLSATPGPAKFGLDTSLDAGTYNVNVRARRTDTTGDIRATLINSAGTVVGTSSWQTLTDIYQTYVLSVTTTATASRVGLEVRA